MTSRRAPISASIFLIAPNFANAVPRFFVVEQAGKLHAAGGVRDGPPT